MGEKQSCRKTIYLPLRELEMLEQLVYLAEEGNHYGRVTISSVVANAIRKLYQEKTGEKEGPRG